MSASKYTFIDRNFYITAMAKPRPGGDAGADQGLTPPPAPVNTGRLPIEGINYNTGVATGADRDEIYSSPIDSQIDLLIKSLENIEGQLKHFKKSGIERMAGEIDAATKSNSETPLSNIAEGISLFEDSGAFARPQGSTTRGPNSLFESIRIEIPKMKQIVDDTSIITFFNMTPDGRAFLEDLKKKIDILDQNYSAPAAAGVATTQNKNSGIRLKELMTARNETVAARKKSLVEALVAKYGADLGEGRISQVLGDVYLQQKGFLKAVEVALDTHGNIEEEGHAGYETYRNNKGIIFVKSKDTKGKTSENKVTQAFVGSRLEAIKILPKLTSEPLIRKLRALKPLASADDALEFTLVTDFVNSFSAGDATLDPVTKKPLKSESMDVITQSVNSYFRNDKSLVSIFTNMIVNFDLFNPQVGNIKKTYSIKDTDGALEAKVLIEYYISEDREQEESNARRNKISATFMYNGEILDLGYQLLEDFLYEKSIKERLFISKINSGNTEYVLEIYNFLVNKYIETKGISELSRFKNSVLWPKLEVRFITNNQSPDEGYDSYASVGRGQTKSGTRSSAMGKVSYLNKLELFKNHPIVLRAMASDGSVWEDILRDPNSALRKSVEQLRQDYASVAQVKDDMDYEGEQPELKAEYDSLNTKIQQAEQKIKSEFPGIDLRVVLDPDYSFGEPVAPINGVNDADPAKAPKKEKINREIGAWKQQLEMIKKQWPVAEAKKNDLINDLVFAKQGTPEYKEIEAQIKEVDRKIGDLTLIVEKYISMGLVDQSEIYSQLTGKAVPAGRKKHNSEELEVIKNKINELQSQYDELSVEIDQSSDDEKQAITLKMTDIANKIKELNNIVVSDISRGGSGLDFKEEAQDMQNKSLEKAIESIKRSERKENPIYLTAVGDQLAWAYFYLLIDHRAKENTQRAIDNLNSKANLRSYIRTNLPTFLSSDKNKPGILDRARELHRVVKKIL